MYKKITTKDINQIILLYESGKKISEISNILNINYNTISYHLQKNKLWKFKGTRKYTCNFNYFSQINNEHKAYWLGFIAADGSVYKNCLHIGIHQKDHKHLLKFKKDIEATYPIKKTFYKSKEKINPMSQINIYNNTLIQHLNKQGIHPNKSKNINWNDFKMPEKLIPHFIRGFFDGDGSWSKAGKNKIKFTITCGSKQFLYPLQQKIAQECNLPINKIEEKNNNNYILSYCGKLQHIKICNYIYNNSSIKLERKYNIIQNLLS